jgi:hypothetical protein
MVEPVLHSSGLNKQQLWVWLPKFAQKQGSIDNTT